MASIVRRPNGCREIRIAGEDGKQVAVRLGRCNEKTAVGVRMHLERLAASRISGTAAPNDTLYWLTTIPARLHERIARAGLCVGRQDKQAGEPLDLQSACKAYASRRTDWQPSTRTVFEQSQRLLVVYFGPAHMIDEITVGEAKDFRRWLAAKYSEAYTSKIIRGTRQLWRDAVDRKLLSENPWRQVTLGSDRNPARQQYVPVGAIEKAIAAVDDPQWKVLIALARYAGLRMPSEPLALTWGDVDFLTGRMSVRAKKTQRYAGKESRIVPIFPELRRHLESLFEADAPAGSVYVISRYRDSNANLRTQFLRILTRAGVQPWPRLFQNLRASCETDLVERFPAHVACAWIGNSEVVARDHYLQVTDRHFETAISRTNLEVSSSESSALITEAVSNGSN